MNLRRSFFLVVVFLIIDETARAQEKTSLFTAPVSVSGGVEDVIGPGGILIPSTSVLLVPVSPTLVKNSQRWRLHLAYLPEFEFVDEGLRRTRFWNHTLGFSYTHAIEHRTRFAIGHSFVKSSDPARLFGDSLYVLPRNEFRENATAITLGHDFSRKTTFGIRLDTTITKISGPDRAVSSAFLDQYGGAGSASFTRHVTERQKFTASYAILKFSPYHFGDRNEASAFLPSFPTVRAGISRYALTLAKSAAESATTPNGIVGGNSISSPSSQPGAAPRTPAAASGAIAAVNALNAAGPAVATPPPSASQAPVVSAATGDPGEDAESLGAELVDELNALKLLGDPFYTLAGTYTYTRGTGLFFQVTGGVIADHEASYLFGTQVDKRYDRWWISAGFEHFRSHYGPVPVEGIPANGSPRIRPEDGASSLFTGASAGIGGKITRSTEVDLYVSASKSTANFVDHDLRYISERARISQWITDRFGLFATVEFFSEDRRERGGSRLDRRRYFGGIQFRVSPPPRTAARVTR